MCSPQQSLFLKVPICINIPCKGQSEDVTFDILKRHMPQIGYAMRGNRSRSEQHTSPSQDYMVLHSEDKGPKTRKDMPNIVYELCIAAYKAGIPSLVLYKETTIYICVQ